ncbi:response regulator [Niabella beijingensis]|uniref:response regulator n=1 Tax=Niabella beijingensis TaxID=2872700 RepID=UPI001CBC5957|nr:response regulator transcription factor [Niabella beijingensis]MBZ4189922.1 response regulator transcription factor [Niabella beijingensis]
MKKNKISVGVVEDHSIIAEGLSTIISSSKELKLAGVFFTAEEAWAFLQKHSVDLLLLDISLPQMSGIELCSSIKQQQPHIKIIALTNHTEKSVIQEMLENGADGYLLKNTSKQDLLTAVCQVMDNRFILPADLQKIVFAPTPPAEKAVPRLTTREKEILQLVSRGTTTSSIAAQLFISPQTVETHRRNLMQKFEVNNSAALIRKATEKGLL